MKTIDPSIEQILNPEVDFLRDVNTCIEMGGECMDCILSFCEKTRIEMEQVFPLIKSSPLKKILQIEAEEKHFLKPRKAKKKL